MCVYGRYAPALDDLFPAVVDAFTTYTILALRFFPFLRPLLKVIVFIYCLANHDNPLPQLTRANGRLTIKSTRLRKRQSVPHVLLVYCSYSATQKISTFMSGSSVRITTFAVKANFGERRSFTSGLLLVISSTDCVFYPDTLTIDLLQVEIRRRTFLKVYFDHCHQTYRNTGLRQNPTPTPWSSCFDTSNSFSHS